MSHRSKNIELIFRDSSICFSWATLKKECRAQEERGMEGSVGEWAVFGSSCSCNKTIVQIVNWAVVVKHVQRRDLFIRHQLKPLC